MPKSRSFSEQRKRYGDNKTLESGRTRSECCIGKELLSFFEQLDVPMDDELNVPCDKQYVKELASRYINLETQSHLHEICVCISHDNSLAKSDNEIYQNVNQAMIQAQDEVLEALNKANMYVLAALENATRKMVNYPSHPLFVLFNLFFYFRTIILEIVQFPLLKLLVQVKLSLFLSPQKFTHKVTKTFILQVTYSNQSVVFSPLLCLHKYMGHTV